MKTQVFRILIFIGTLITLMSAGMTAVFSAVPSVSYTPSATIPLSWSSTSGVRMDTAGIIYNSGASVGAPVFNTSSKSFSWGFYITDYGWATFSTGSYQVGLNCGSQYLSGLTANCTLTGTGWSDTIGEIGFSGVQFIPRSRTLSGSITSFVGNFDVSGIALPLGKAEFRWYDLMHDNLIANHGQELTLSGEAPGISTLMIDFGGIWRSYTAVSGKFTWVDITKSGNSWKFTITNSGGTTMYNWVPVMAGAPKVWSLTWIPSSVITDYCNNYPSQCPDGASLAATSLSWATSWVIADGSSPMNFTLKLRDEYGNRVGGQTVKITYDTTVRKWQVDISENTEYASSLLWNAYTGTLTWQMMGYADKTFSTNTSSDIYYSIASYAPTNNSSDLIHLKKITYDGIDTWLVQSNLTFEAPWTASLDTSGQLYVKKPHDFSLKVTSETNNTLSWTIVPDIIGNLTIDTSDIDEYWSLDSSNPTMLCQKEPKGTSANPCDWYSSGTFFAINTGSTTGTPIRAEYKTNTPNIPNNTTLKTYIHYQIGGNDILYLSNASIPYSALTDPYKILGNSNGGSISTSTARTDFFNEIRKNIAYLTRAYQPSSSLEYVFSWSDMTISSWDPLNEKRTFIVVWGDITISTDIQDSAHPPIAFIALAKDGTWGNIIIDGSVKNLQATLIAEKNISWSGSADNQLFIYGSVIAQNALNAAGIQEIRKDYTWQDSSKYSSAGPTYNYTPVVVKYDNRILTDPPPGLRDFNP